MKGDSVSDKAVKKVRCSTPKLTVSLAEATTSSTAKQQVNRSVSISLPLPEQSSAPTEIVPQVVELKSDGSEADILNLAINEIEPDLSSEIEEVFEGRNTSSAVIDNTTEAEKVTTDGSTDEASQQINLLESETSSSSVALALNTAMDANFDLCSNYWWQNLDIPVYLKDVIVGKGVKRKTCASCNQSSGPSPKKFRGLDICEEMSALFVSSLQTKHASDPAVNSSEKTAKVSQNLDVVTCDLKNLALCDCLQDHCLTCTIAGLHLLCDAVDWVGSSTSSLPAKPTVPSCANRASVPSEASTCSNVLDSNPVVPNPTEGVAGRTGREGSPPVHPNPTEGVAGRTGR